MVKQILTLVAVLALAFIVTNNSFGDDTVSYVADKEAMAAAKADPILGQMVYNEEIHDGQAVALADGAPFRVMALFNARRHDLSIAEFYNLNPKWSEVQNMPMPAEVIFGYVTGSKNLVASN